MPQFARSLNVAQGFNFRKDKQSSVGFITELTVGKETLVADQKTVLDPLNPGTALDGVVGVLGHYMWELGTTDAIYLSAQISTENKQLLTAALLGEMTDMTVKFSYSVYEYDPVAKNYFLSNKGEDLEGILEKNGDSLNLSVADDESTEVQSPKNFTLQMGIKPDTKEQTIVLATGAQKNVAKKWGITAAG
ncbi:hypothetical protein [Melittangium boletus]|uniref:Phage tail protein n=1 Tax=Melittangium boletus DSM 14713 TaxID=1294270 RepID=A0A250IQI0_9BACT|nr:hypothetical protein [Melittangium boletus]ATB33994.1 hypothetical protein MEBOL_007495 [Melittangium boletus DSM 14713]